MKRIIVGLMLVFGTLLIPAPAHATGIQRDIISLYYDAGYRGTYRPVYVDDYGDCDSSGYHVTLSGPISQWSRNLTSLHQVTDSPHCNFVILHNMNYLTGQDQGECGRQYLPIYNVAQIGSCKNDSIYGFQVVYYTGPRPFSAHR